MKAKELIWRLPASAKELVALQIMARNCNTDVSIPHYFVTYNDLKTVDGFRQENWDDGLPFDGIRGRVGLLEPTYWAEIDGHGDVIFIDEDQLVNAGCLPPNRRVARTGAVHGALDQDATIKRSSAIDMRVWGARSGPAKCTPD